MFIYTISNIYIYMYIYIYIRVGALFFEGPPFSVVLQERQKESTLVFSPFCLREGGTGRPVAAKSSRRGAGQCPDLQQPRAVPEDPQEVPQEMQPGEGDQQRVV